MLSNQQPKMQSLKFTRLFFFDHWLLYYYKFSHELAFRQEKFDIKFNLDSIFIYMDLEENITFSFAKIGKRQKGKFFIHNDVFI